METLTCSRDRPARCPRWVGVMSSISGTAAHPALGTGECATPRKAVYYQTGLVVRTVQRERRARGQCLSVVRKPLQNLDRDTPEDIGLLRRDRAR